MPIAHVTISTGQAEVYYDSTGVGPGVVLVHGTRATREQWLPLTTALADRYTVVAPDYSGSGHTVDPGGPLTLADMAEEILAAADHAQLAEFHLVGHSLGAVIASQLAAAHPNRVLSLVLHAGWVRADTRMAAMFQHWVELLRVDAAHGTTLFAQTLAIDALGPRYWAGTTLATNAQFVAEFASVIAAGTDRQTTLDMTVDLTNQLARITAPTLVLASAHDLIIPADQQQALLAGIADSRYPEIDAGHGAPAEDPDGFAARIAGFLDGQASNRALATGHHQ
jgi:pimeloyl-ACP methyl ester carboxylesterase